MTLLESHKLKKAILDDSKKSMIDNSTPQSNISGKSMFNQDNLKLLYGTDNNKQPIISKPKTPR